MIGVSIFTLFVLSSIVVNESVQALNQAAGNYGYYGGTYGFNDSTASSDQVPNTPGSQAVGVGSGQAVVSWTAVTTTRTAGTDYDNHSSYRVVYGTTSADVLLAYASNNGDAILPSGTSAWTSTNDTGLATRGSSGNTIRTTITGLTNGTTYYFAAYACDTNANCSDAPSVAVSGAPAAGTSSSGGGGGGSGGGTTTPGATTYPSGTATTDTGVSEGTGATTSSPAAIATSVQSSALEFGVTLSTTQVNTASSFISSGTTMATVKLGSGERLALVRDQLETLGRVDVAALEQLAVGQKPTARNLAKEQVQVGKVLTAFVKLTGHRPNFKIAKEDLAWNTMMYRIRFARDLNKERAGITMFRSVYGRTPTSPLDWAAVRAWGYSLK